MFEYRARVNGVPENLPPHYKSTPEHPYFAYSEKFLSLSMKRDISVGKTLCGRRGGRILEGRGATLQVLNVFL